MGLIALPKKKAAAPPDELLSAFADEIDRVGKLMEEAEPIAKQIKDLQAKLKPLAEAQKALAKKIDELEIDDDAEVVEKGAHYQAEIGKRGNQREIKNMGLAKEYLGAELFMQVATITLKDLDAYLTLPQREEVLTVKRTAHSAKVIKRQP